MHMLPDSDRARTILEPRPKSLPPKPRRVGWAVALGGLLVVLLLLVVVRPLLAQVPQPGLTAALTNANQLQIVITNGSGSVNYEIYRTPVLGDEENFPFTLHLIGNPGQTSFVANFGIETRGFFSAAVGSDWDGDGVPNFMDANPSSTNAGALFITIDSPTNGASIQ